MDKSIAITLTVVWIVAAAVSLFPVVMSVFLFDAPGATLSPLTIALFVAVLALPVFWLAGAILPWLFRGRPIGPWLFALPLVDIVAIIAIFVAISQFCGGKLACK